jgi:hypothetical protein
VLRGKRERRILNQQQIVDMDFETKKAEKRKKLVKIKTGDCSIMALVRFYS